MTSDARARPREDDESAPTPGAGSTDVGAADIETTDAETTDADTAATAEPDEADTDTDTADTGTADTDVASPAKRGQRRDRAAARGSVQPPAGSRGGPQFPVVPVLTVLLVVLLAGVGYLWFTRPATSSIRTSDYVGALQAARSGVVDLTSFDYLTLDDDLRQIQQVTTGDLRKESTDQLNQRRKAITDSQAVVNTKIIGAGVTKADPDNATVVLVIESTTKTKASTQAEVVRYRIEVQVKDVNGRWLLSGITGR